MSERLEKPEKPVKEKEFAPTVDSTTKVNKAKKELERQNKSFGQKMKEEPKVKVYGNPIYIGPLGKVYTFLYNGLTVSIKFDEKYHEYPATIAKQINRKLADTARANTPKEENVEL